MKTRGHPLPGLAHSTMNQAAPAQTSSIPDELVGRRAQMTRPATAIAQPGTSISAAPTADPSDADCVGLPKATAVVARAITASTDHAT